MRRKIHKWHFCSVKLNFCLLCFVLWQLSYHLLVDYVTDRSVFFRVAPWASYQIRKIAGAHAPGMPETFSPPPRVNDRDMLHGTCGHARAVMHAGIANPRFPLKAVMGKTFPAFPAQAQTRNFTYLVRGPYDCHSSSQVTLQDISKLGDIKQQ